jgi:hypothetical protein
MRFRKPLTFSFPEERFRSKRNVTLKVLRRLGRNMGRS